MGTCDNHLINKTELTIINVICQNSMCKKSNIVGAYNFDKTSVMILNKFNKNKIVTIFRMPYNFILFDCVGKNKMAKLTNIIGAIPSQPFEMLTDSSPMEISTD